LARGIDSSVVMLMESADCLAWVPAQGPDVLLQPFERGDLVEGPG
jgi:hypothetical protein